MVGDDAHNEMSGTAVNSVQAGTIAGGVHFHTGKAATLPIPRQLPAGIAHFSDREAHVERLDDWLANAADPVSPITIIVGVGGVGKTSLATHWAHGVRDTFPDGDLYVDFRGFHPDGALSAEAALDQVLRALGVQARAVPPDFGGKAALYRSILHGRRVLVVLDNVGTERQARALLPGSPTCRVLITSRVGLTGLVTTEGARRIRLDVLPPDRAVELLTGIIGAERARDEPDAVAGLARLCGHLPLALRIAAGRLVSDEHLAAADLVDELTVERERLDALSTDDEASTVRTVFSWSYRALPPEAARLFRLLSLPTGPDIGLLGAAALADRSVTRTRRILESLVNAHLVREDAAARFHFHDLIALYAAECAAADESPEQRHLALVRLISWYTASADAATRLHAPHYSRIPVALPETAHRPPPLPDGLSALHWCDAERANLVAAVGQAAGIGETTLAWRLPVVLFGMFLTRRPLADWVATHLIGVEAARSCGERLAETWLHTSVGLAYRALRRDESALEHLEVALAGWRESGERWGEAWTLRDIGDVRRLMGDVVEAVDLLTAALAIHVEEQDAFGEASALRELSTAQHALGRYDEALANLERALAIRLAMGDHGSSPALLAAMSLAHSGAGRTAEAIDHGERALELSRSLDNPHQEAEARDALGDALAKAGLAEPAKAQWQAALELYEALRDPRSGELGRKVAG
ncbi:tetratricopeptide repeat protein [Umezawaea sp. Da 62-37]|uniref:ATP-binding protein n=1 Tax=Umezawaea sp. Da 62-37 TaxID=3075927 RepID=UPI0028F721BD|nr:tetratricopeptide repeat protein [Umezawaea sp. Da 62-37]WNV87239.1 tetratricopeptide repeat protein [Umezawaea sp. Da 62-37]